MIYANLPGLGKTLALLMTFTIGRNVGDRPSLVVVPASCCRQWIEPAAASCRMISTNTM